MGRRTRRSNVPCSYPTLPCFRHILDFVAQREGITIREASQILTNNFVDGKAPHEPVKPIEREAPSARERPTKARNATPTAAVRGSAAKHPLQMVKTSLVDALNRCNSITPYLSIILSQSLRITSRLNPRRVFDLYPDFQSLYLTHQL
jgi:hypothetical protein